VDVAHKWGAEAVDEELDRLISKRASQEMRPDPDEQEERWKASVRAYRAVAPLIAFHEGRAAELLGSEARPSFARGGGG
jgi:hypothetical protein